MSSPARTILIVDDEYSIAETLGEILAWEGYAVSMAPNGREALARIEKCPPQLVLLDFMMPVMDGIETLRVLRARPALASIPVIMMTAARMSLPEGEPLYDALLRKPFEIDAVLKLVRALIAR